MVVNWELTTDTSMRFMEGIARRVREAHPALWVPVSRIRTDRHPSGVSLGVSGPDASAGEALGIEISFFEKDGVITAVGDVVGASRRWHAEFRDTWDATARNDVETWVHGAQQEIVRRIEKVLPQIDRIIEDELAYELQHPEPDSVTLRDEDWRGEQSPTGL